MPRVTRYGWDGERMCAEVTDELTRTTIYEPGSHVPLLRIDQEEPTPEPVPKLDLAPGVQRLFAPPRPKPPARIAHYHTDQLGTPLMLTGPEGKVLWRASPDDWAAVCDEKGETDQPIRFQGQQLDNESGLHYNWHRYYDPSTGRYVTQDPIGLAGGVNTYGYVWGNPVSMVDPSGLSTVTYDGQSHTITIQDSNGNTVGTYPANNKTTITSSGPWPNGTNSYAYSNPHPESGANGPYGSHGIFVFNVPGRTGMGLHSGRANSGAQNHPTLGCVRTTDTAMAFLRNLVTTDPLTSITVINNNPNAPQSGTQQ